MERSTANTRAITVVAIAVATSAAACWTSPPAGGSEVDVDEACEIRCGADTARDAEADAPTRDTARRETGGPLDTGEPADTRGDTSMRDADPSDGTPPSDAGDGGDDGQALPSEQVLFRVDFEETDPGQYTRQDYADEWPAADWTDGLEDGRGRIVEDPEEAGNQALEVLYPADVFGSRNHGVQWQLTFGDQYDELYLQYRLRFQEEFQFVKGGKLPGLFGGEGNTGGDAPDGTDGWSARMMWRRAGKVIQYVYHPDQPGTYGEEFEYRRNGEVVSFEPGTWHTVQHRIVMNTPGQSDGRIQAWFDGQLALDETGLRFRDIADFAVDGFYFSTFFGGGNDTWAPDSDMHIYYDDFVVARERIPAP